LAKGRVATFHAFVDGVWQQMFSGIRKVAGRLRDQSLHGRRFAELARKSQAARQGWIAAAALSLPPLPRVSAPKSEAHILCSTDHHEMGIWAAWSLLRYLPQTRLVLHLDGAIPAGAAQQWSRLFPDARILTRRESLVLVDGRLANFGAVRRWTAAYYCGLKLGGFHAAALTDRLIELDADTLVLRQPHVLLQWLDQDAVRMRWNRDHRQCYAYPWRLVRDVVGNSVGPPPELLNGGFILAQRMGDTDWAFLEDVLARFDADPRTDPLRYWMHQTIAAIFASTLGDAAHALPADYAVSKGATLADTTMRHFAGHPDMRPRFFTEGVGLVIQDAIVQGHLPADFPQGPRT
jgi:hypothetical protein